MADYTFKRRCDCGNKPILKDVGMCSVCTFGEASSMWDWLDDFPKSEKKLAEKYVLNLFRETELADDEGNINPIVSRLLHIDQDVLDQIEERVMS